MRKGQLMKFRRQRVPSVLWAKLAPLARQMRHEPTPAEELLWRYLRDRRLIGVKFRRQVPLERFIVDFYSSQEWLIVEVDGEYHQHTGEEDVIRQEYLESLGLRVVRVSNDDVIKNLEGVLAWIVQQIENLRGRRGR